MISEVEEREVDKLASLLSVNKEEALRLAIKEGIHELRIRKATELYVSGKASVKQAARFAWLDLADWFAIAREKNLIVQIRPEELDEDVEALQELK
jgi:predicted HTH domain antitoxin